MPIDHMLKPIEAALDMAFPRYPLNSSVRDMLKAFWPVDRLIADLYSGDVYFDGPTPIMIDHDGSFGEITPSLTGWCSVMERIAARLQLPLDMGHVRRVAKRLEAGILIDVSDIDRIAALINRCRAIYMACPVWVRKQETAAEIVDINIHELIRRAA